MYRAKEPLPLGTRSSEPENLCSSEHKTSLYLGTTSAPKPKKKNNQQLQKNSLRLFNLRWPCDLNPTGSVGGG